MAENTAAGLQPYPQVGGRQRELTENGVDFWNITANSQGHTSFHKATPPNPSNTVPPTGDQICK